MIDHSYFRYSILAVLIVSLAASLLAAYDLAYQFYVWEFFLDGRLLVLMLLAWLGWKKGGLKFSIKDSLLHRFDLFRNILIFAAPLALYLVPVAAGYFLNGVKIEAMDNAVTLILATLFDIPAVFVFSATTILVEELLFRSVIFPSAQTHFGKGKGILLSVMIWTLYCIPEVISVPELPPIGQATLLLYFIMIGTFCTALYHRNASVWAGYSFRTGIAALTPIVISSVITESDSFVTATSPLFGAEGAIVSGVLFVCSVILFRRTAQSAISA
ncbi:MAG: CPBP family intramembrane metalloprotease [Bacteroidetes bacterium]|nr:CPBP family intramembrane metalloprotease [Bacteroidota bacterium]